MIRIVFENLLLFLLPTLIYLAYAVMTRKAATGDPNAPAAGAKPALLDDAPLLYLFAAGVLLVVVTLTFFSSNTGGRPDQPYTPPSMKNGRIEPGHVD